MKFYNLGDETFETDFKSFQIGPNVLLFIFSAHLIVYVSFIIA